MCVCVSVSCALLLTVQCSCCMFSSLNGFVVCHPLRTSIPFDIRQVQLNHSPICIHIQIYLIPYFTIHFGLLLDRSSNPIQFETKSNLHFIRQTLRKWTHKIYWTTGFIHSTREFNWWQDANQYSHTTHTHEHKWSHWSVDVWLSSGCHIELAIESIIWLLFELYFIYMYKYTFECI